jgi:hypothetical protein
MRLTFAFMFVVIGSLAFGPAAGQGGTSMCNSRLTPQEGQLGYRMRGNTHCEGLYERLVAPGSLRPVSLVRADQPVPADYFSLSWPMLDGKPQVRLQAMAFKQGMLYRMDTMQAGSGFTWPTEVLRKLGLQKSELGVIATADKAIKGMNEHIYLPVDLSPAAKTARGTYILKVASVEDLSEIYLTVSGPIDVDQPSPGPPATVIGDRPLKSSYYSAAAPIQVPLDLKGQKAGIYQVRIAGRRMNRDGSTTTSFYMRHAD